MKQILLFLIFIFTSFYVSSQEKFVLENNFEDAEIKMEVLPEIIINAYSFVTKSIIISCCAKSECYKLSCLAEGKEISMVDEKPLYENDLILFPNPSSNGLFNLKGINNFNELEVKVYSISGQFIKTNTFLNSIENTIVDLTQQPKGIYLIQLIAGGKYLSTKKAVIN